VLYILVLMVVHKMVVVLVEYMLVSKALWAVVEELCIVVVVACMLEVFEVLVHCILVFVVVLAFVAVALVCNLVA